jgi:hypothetical protein
MYIVSEVPVEVLFTATGVLVWIRFGVAGVGEVVLSSTQMS